MKPSTEPAIIFDDITQAARGKFHGGIHPLEFKTLSNQQPIRTLPAADELVLPLRQSSGQASKLVVKEGETVIQGQLVARKQPGISANLHAPLAGKIVSTQPRFVGHISGMPSAAITLRVDADKKNDFKASYPPLIWQDEPSQNLVERIEEAGIVGLGGATFPTSIKLSQPAIETLVVNAMECEPYITCDDRMLQELAAQVIEGAQIVANIVSANNIVFATEDNKPAAIASLQQAIKASQWPRPMMIVVAPTKYPSGGEKQTIELVTGKQVPAGKLPASLGLLIQNVATLYAVYEAVVLGYPLIRRLVTITGNLVNQPGNYWIHFGTPLEYVMRYFAVAAKDCENIIIGGPLMGQSVSDDSTPVTKATNCLIFNRPDAADKIWLTQAAAHQPCIRCGECEKVCPAQLLPQQLFWYSQSEQWDNLQDQGISDCIECGACAYVCPSQIPLVHYYRFAKSSLKKRQQEQAKSDKARARFEFREMRLERAKAERALKHQQAAEARRQEALKQDEASVKQAAISDALQRVKDKKMAQTQAQDEQRD